MSDAKPKPFAESAKMAEGSWCVQIEGMDLDASCSNATAYRVGRINAAVAARERAAAAKALRDYSDDVMKKFMPYQGYFASDFKSGAERTCRQIANYLRARADAVERGE